LLSKSLKEESGSPVLFRFLADSVLFLENATTDFENFHLAFLLQLTFFLGFGPDGADEFDAQLRENDVPFLPDAEAVTALNTFLRLPYGTPVRLSRHNRNELLDAVVAYYGIHIDSLGEVRSLTVLREVMG
jgi:DNA repair protein RecO (recombination protein O)